MAGIDPVERLTDLWLYLQYAGSPRTLRDIANDLPGYQSYEGRPDTLRKTFQRDVEALAAEGIIVRTVVDRSTADARYEIDDEASYLPELTLDPGEETILSWAASSLHDSDATGHHALDKLGFAAVATRGLPALLPLADLPIVPVLGTLHTAIATRQWISFTYHDRDRLIAPGGLVFRGGYWYLVGWRAGERDWRTFRVDRIQGDVTYDEEAPEDAAWPLLEASSLQALVPRGRGFGADVAGQHALVEVDAIEAPRVTDELPPGSLRETRDDGSILVEIGVTQWPAFRGWLLELGQHARLLQPAELVTEMVAWLDATIEVQGTHLGNGAAPEGAAQGQAAQDQAAQDQAAQDQAAQDQAAQAQAAPDGVAGRSVPKRRSAERKERPSKVARLHRLFAVLAYLAGQCQEGQQEVSVPIAELSRRFDMEPDALVSELEMAACCGLPPYTGDQLIDLIVDADTVTLERPQVLLGVLARPRRLSRLEAFGILVALEALATENPSLEGDIHSLLGKLRGALDGAVPNRADPVLPTVDLGAPPLASALAGAVSERAQVVIEYHSVSQDSMTTRQVEPVAIFQRRGRWYLDAWCHLAGDWRRFRVDHIRSVERAGESIPEERLLAWSARSSAGRRASPAASLVPGDPPFVAGPDVAMVQISVPGNLAWLLDELGWAVVEASEGRVVLELPVGGRAWLERLLLVLGPDVQVLSAPEDLREAGAVAARRLLESY